MDRQFFKDPLRKKNIVRCRRKIMLCARATLTKRHLTHSEQDCDNQQQLDLGHGHKVSNDHCTGAGNTSYNVQC